MLFKKLVAVSLGLSLLCTTSLTSGALETEEPLTETEEKIYSTLTLEDDFISGEIIAVMKKGEIVTEDVGTKETGNFFGVTGYIEELSVEPEDCDTGLVNAENYHQILSVKIPEANKAETLAAAKIIEQSEAVLSAAPDRYFEMEPEVESVQAEGRSLSSQWGLNYINVSTPWSYSTTGSQTAKVGVIDSGVESTHTGLIGNLDMSLAKNFTDDGLGLQDTVGHGTKVAGVIGATGNYNSIFGVCKNITLIPLKAAKYQDGKGVGKYAWLAAAISYAQENGISILNYSAGGASVDTVVQNAIANYSGLLITSAGNSSQNTDDSSTPHYPSGYTNSNVIAVASLDKDETLAAHSNYGATSIDLAAPGMSILTTALNNSSVKAAGTSLAAPFVTGVVALLKSHYPNLTVAQIRTCILNGTTPLSSLSGKVVTGGVLNAEKAFKIAMGIATGEHKLVCGDFNGDGRDDMMSIATIGYTHTRFLVSLSNGSQFQEWTTWMESTGIMPSCYGQRVGAGDVNDDGKDDIITLYQYPNGDVKFFVYLSNGNGFSGSQIWGSWASGNYDTSCVGKRFAVGDFNGDNKADCAVMYFYPDSTTKIFTYLSTGSAFTSSQTWQSWPENAFSADCVDDRFVAGDFNGDGKDDLALMYRHGSLPAKVNLYTYLSTGSTFSSSQNFREWPSGAYSTNCVGGRFTSGDFNGDGKDDISVLYYADNQSRAFVYLSNGSQFTVNTWKTWTTGSFDANCIGSKFVAGDFSGDGKRDVVSLYKYPSGNVCAFEQNSTGSAFSAHSQWW